MGNVDSNSFIQTVTYGNHPDPIFPKRGPVTFLALLSSSSLDKVIMGGEFGGEAGE